MLSSARELETHRASREPVTSGTVYESQFGVFSSENVLSVSQLVPIYLQQFPTYFGRGFQREALRMFCPGCMLGGLFVRSPDCKLGSSFRDAIFRREPSINIIFQHLVALEQHFHCKVFRL
jgi:hypothetical protein